MTHRCGQALGEGCPGTPRGIFPRRRLVLPANGDAGHQRVPVQAGSRQTIPRYPALRSGVQWTARDDSAGMS